MSFFEQEYRVKRDVDLGGGISNILGKYKNITLDFNNLVYDNYDLLFDEEVYTLEELFEFYNPWDVRFLVKEGFLDGELLTNKECRSIHTSHFLNTNEGIIEKRNKTLRTKEYRELASQYSLERWHGSDEKYGEGRINTLEGLFSWMEDSELNEQRIRNIKKTKNTQEFKCTTMKRLGVSDYRKYLVNFYKKVDKNMSYSQLFHYFLRRVRDDKKEWGFIAPKSSREEDDKCLRKRIKDNFFLFNHLLKTFDNNPVLKKASKHIKENNIDVSLNPENYEGYKELVKIFGIKRSKKNYYYYSEFHRDYYPKLLVCSLVEEEYDKKELYEVLVDEAHELLFIRLSNTSEPTKFYRRFYRSIKKLKKKGWISC